MALTMPRNSLTHPFRGLGNRIFVMGREEIQRHISPVTAFLGILLEHREQLDRRNSELLQVRDLLNQSRVSAPLFRGHTGIRPHREASYVHFVDDGIRGMDRPPIPGPVEPVVGDDHSERRSTGVASWNPRRLTAEVRWAEQGSGVRVKEYLLIVETVARSRLIGPATR